MKNLLYITSNSIKFEKAQSNLVPLGIHLIQDHCDMVELQIDNGDEIVRHKAEQAFQVFQQPLLVNDDLWSIPALRGFPGPNMKQCNHFLRAEDWLRLMNGIADRRVFLNSHYAYHDGHAIRTMMKQDELYFLTERRGENKNSPCLEVVAWKGQNESIAEVIAAGKHMEPDTAVFWQELAGVLQKS